MRCRVGQNPTVATVEMLAPIWERVLRRPLIGPDDNFFDLGGDPAMAVQLFKEIAKVCERSLPPITIYQAPTLATLAAFLAEATPQGFPAVVKLRDGFGNPPVFIAHGMGGSVMEIFQLVKSIQTERAIYGLQSNGFNGNEEPLARVEDMAQRFIEVMKDLQPHGPYALIGYSFGGLVMLEIAQRLFGQGEKVALLAMLESYPHHNMLPLSQRLALFARRAKHHAAIFGRLSMRKKFAYATRKSERMHASRNLTGESARPENGLSPGTAEERYRSASELAMIKYSPRFYRGKINFVRAARQSSSFPDDPRVTWQKLSDKFEMDEVPGDHFGIITSHYQDLASVLSRYLAAAFGE
jgi:acetoacetyl-CoA synthetase